MFNFLRKIFNKPGKNDFVDEKGNVTKSAIAYNSKNERYLKLLDSDCAIVLHGDNKVEVIFTKDYNDEDQTITSNEETLMSIACFMKQPGFLEMITTEFRKIAKTKIEALTKNIEDDK